MHKFADVDVVLRSASAALRTTLHAARTGDRTGAAAVVAEAAGHAAEAEAARAVLRSRPWVPAPQVARQVRVVDDVEEALRVVVRIAALVALDGRPLPSPGLDRDLRRLAEAGERRLRHVQDGCVFEAGDAGCTAVLLDVADRTLGAGGLGVAGGGVGEGEGGLGRLVGELAGVLLRVSRDAAVAA